MPDAMFIFDQCCFCVELRAGCFVIAYVQLFVEALTFALFLYGIVEGAVLMTSSVESVNELAFILLMFSVLFLAFLGLIFVFTIVLIIGLHKRNSGQIRAYLICAMIFLPVYVTTAFVSFPMVTFAALDMIYKVISLVMYVYSIVVIRSYWIQIGKNRSDGYRYTIGTS
ncbi:unnamed protein product, partial [Iphiclides podalirius]